MIPTAEQLLEAFRMLPPTERQKFFDLAKAEKKNGGSSNGLNSAEVAGQIDRHRRALIWISENKVEYDGQWVCLYGDQLIAHGDDGRKVFEEARAKGIETPFLERIRAEELPFGGW